MVARISPDQIAHFRRQQTGVLELRLQELQVCEYYQVIFSPEGITSLSKQDVTGFLRFENNKRWKEISREVVTHDMERLRKALLVLVDESLPIATRLNQFEPVHGQLSIPHLGKAKLSAILLVTHPRQYGVWNDYSQRSLEAMGLMPEFEIGSRLGEQYDLFNRVLLDLATQHQVSLWWLDMILEKIARLIR